MHDIDRSQISSSRTSAEQAGAKRLPHWTCQPATPCSRHAVSTVIRMCTVSRLPAAWRQAGHQVACPVTHFADRLPLRPCRNPPLTACRAADPSSTAYPRLAPRRVHAHPAPAIGPLRGQRSRLCGATRCAAAAPPLAPPPKPCPGSHAPFTPTFVHPIPPLSSAKTAPCVHEITCHRPSTQRVRTLRPGGVYCTARPCLCRAQPGERAAAGAASRAQGAQQRQRARAACCFRPWSRASARPSAPCRPPGVWLGAAP